MNSTCESQGVSRHSIYSNEKGVILSVVIMLITVLAITGSAAYIASKTDIKISDNYKNGTKVLYLAEAAVTYARHALTQDWDLDTNSVNDQTQVFTNNQTVNWDSTATLASLESGSSGSVTIARDATDASLAIITSTASYGSSTKVIKHIVKKVSVFPTGVKAATTSNGPVETLGTLEIDGRNHSSSCSTVVSTSGTYGVFSYDAYTQSGNSKVGGTETSGPTDYAPSKPGDSSIIVANSTDTMATTPDEVMGGAANGFPADTLKGIAQAGVNGQYVTDTSNLTYPLSGATYVELPCGGTWNPANIDGSGVLVVHNSCTDAVIKNLNSGTFNGLLIADDIVHVHTDIIGAVYSLTTSPSSGNAIGNGNGKICYSTETLSNLALGSMSIQKISWLEEM